MMTGCPASPSIAVQHAQVSAAGKACNKTKVKNIRAVQVLATFSGKELSGPGPQIKGFTTGRPSEGEVQLTRLHIKDPDSYHLGLPCPLRSK